MFLSGARSVRTALQGSHTSPTNAKRWEPSLCLSSRFRHPARPESSVGEPAAMRRFLYLYCHPKFEPEIFSPFVIMLLTVPLSRDRHCLAKNSSSGRSFALDSR